MVGKAFTKGRKPYSRSDTFFSVKPPIKTGPCKLLDLITIQEYELHNPDSMILSTTKDSYIIGNLESYDKRQYPSWLDQKYASKTPEGQGFGHSFVIPRRRIFNIVDHEAIANDCAPIKEMKTHFLNYWNDLIHRKELLHSVENVFGAQNHKLSEKNEAEFEATSPRVTEDYHEMAKQFLRLEAEDFVFAFHPYPDYSVGHLHMHIFPKDEALRRVSSKQHDKKTIPLEAVLQVEEEDKLKGKV